MEDQIPPSNMPIPGSISPEQLAEMKARAREMAVQQALASQAQMQPTQQVVYVKRNLTIAELLFVFLISCGIVTGIQGVWYCATNILPRIEVKMR